MKHLRNRQAGAALAFFFCCTLPVTADETQVEAARQLAQSGIIVDTHIDSPYRIKVHWEDLSQLTAKGEFDYVRAREGGLDVPFLVVYTPPSTEDEGTSFQVANQLFDHVEALAGRAPDKFMLVSSAEEAEAAFEAGKLGLAIGMENGSPIEGKLENVAYFKARGASYISLAHGKANHLSDSSYDDERRWNGLSDFGKQVIAEMNRVGVMVDVSHLSDEAFWDAVGASKVPVIASHSAARHFTPGYERNLSDEMIEAVAKSGGVIMINFGSSFITQAGRQWFDEMVDARQTWMDEHDIDPKSPERYKFNTLYREENPFPYAGLDELVANFRYVIDLVGVEHVGFGSDFDGVGDSLPVGMKDVSDYPNLIARLLEAGYSEQDLRAMMGGNLLRVWRQADAFAKKAAAE